MILFDRNLSDFAHYYFFSDLLSGGVDIYSLPADELAQLKSDSALPVYIAGKPEYSPAFFIAFIPLSRLPFWIAFCIWMCANILAILACIVLLARYLCRSGVYKILSYALASVLCLASQPLFECLGIGQINIFILLLFLIIHSVIDKDSNEFAVGACLALILLTKPQFGTLFILFLVLRRFRYCGYTILVFFVFHIMAAVLYGSAQELSYWRNLMLNAAVDTQTISNTFNLSLKAVFFRTLHGSALEIMAMPAYFIASIALFITKYIRAAGSRYGDSSVGFSLCLCLTLLVSPLTEEHHLLILALPFAVTIVRHDQKRFASALIIVAFLLVNVRYSVAQFPLFHMGPLAVFAFGKTLGILLLWFTLLRFSISSLEKVNEPTAC